MAEDYASSKFNSYHSEQSQPNIDICSLYVKSVPADLSNDTFQALFSAFGKIERFRLYPPWPNYNVTCGLVSFATPLEAQRALRQLNHSPPYNLDISYANKSNSNSKDGNMNRFSTDSSQLNCAPKSFGMGQGQGIQIDKIPLKINLDGNKRVVIMYDSQERKMEKEISNSQLPEIIPSQCLFCKKPGEFSCGECKLTYCSRTCQVKDWQHHKAVCKSNSEKKSQPHCDIGYMSECSNSDSENRTNGQLSNAVTSIGVLRNNTKSFQSSSTAPEQSISLQNAASKEVQKVTTIIKSHEIESMTLPLNGIKEVYVCNFQSPSKLWLHLKTAKAILFEMEKKLAYVVDKSTITCNENDVCCTVQNNVIRRVKVLEERPDSVTAEFIDYGGSVTVKNELLYHLPLAFKEYSSQAIRCKLVDTNGCENTQWKNEDFTSFHQYTKDKLWKVKAYRCRNNVYDVSLLNDEDVSLYSIAQSFVEQLADVPGNKDFIDSGFENWNPMAEDYASPKFNSYHSEQSQPNIDICSLYVKSVPADLSNDTFQALFSAFGKIERFRLYPPWPNYNVTCGLVSFATPLEAQRALRQLNHSPPYNLDISYANKSNSNSKDGNMNRFSTDSSQLNCAPKSFGMGQGQGIQIDKIVTTIIKSHEIESMTLPLNGIKEVYVCNFQSPSKLWLHLKTAKAILFEMEKKLAYVVDKSTITCNKNDVCCTVQNNVIRRVKVLEEKPDSVTAEFIDYGGSVTVKNDLLYHLPLAFKEYSSQAIRCKLVDTNGCENTQWKNEDFTSFHQYTKNKLWKVKAYRCRNNVYDVSLLNDEDVSLYSIAQSFVEPLADVPGNKECSLGKVPSVLSNLKEGSQVTVMAMEMENDKFWGVLDDGSGFNDCLLDIENLLLKVDTETKDINMCCEEGDLAVGFSDKFQQYFRCVVLKRLHSSFLVFYIDFGNEEEITKLRSTFPALLQMKSYVICCTKPNSLTVEKFQKLFKPEKSVQMSVGSNGSHVVELSVTYENRLLTVQCFPWDHKFSNATSKQSPLSDGKVKQESPSSKCPPKPPLHTVFNLKNKENKFYRPNSPNLPKVSGNTPKVPERIMKDLIPDKELIVGVKYDVKIIGIVSATERLYVQLNEDGNRLISFCQQLNQYCTSETSTRYIPVKDEVVCCKYSEDNNWYRAQVLNKPSGNEFEVHFIDFGNNEIVPDINIKPLPKRFICTKFSVCALLMDVKMKDLTKPLFNKLLQEEEWVMEVKETSKPAKVLLFLGQKPLFEFMNVENKFLKNSLNFQKLSATSSTEVIICFVDHEKLYLNKVKDLNDMKILQEKINSKDKKALSNKPEVNNVYCCLAEDKFWYRACVEKEISDSSFEVYFIDFGNTELVSINNFKELTKETFSPPVYCVAVVAENVNYSSLSTDAHYYVEVTGEKAGVQKVKFLNLSDDQKNPKLSSFEKLTLQIFVNEVMFLHSENGIHYCQLTKDIENCAIMCAKLQTVELKPLCKAPQVTDVFCAKSSDGCWYRATLEGIDKTNYKVSFIDYGNSELVSSDKTMFLPSEFHKYPIFCIPLRIKNLDNVNIDFTSVFSLKATGFASDGTAFVEVILPNSMDLPNITSLKKQLLPVNMDVEVVLCYVESDVHYVQMVTSQDMITAIESKLQNAATFKGLSGLPKEGDVICAKYTDGVWYRGAVKEVCDDKNNCTVLFVDYGNTENIALADLKILPEALCTSPVLSVPIKFTNIEELQNQLQANCTVLKVKAKNSADKIQLVEVVVPSNDGDLCSIVPQALPTTLTEVCVPYKENGIVYVQKISDLPDLQEMTKCLHADGSLQKISTPKVGQLLCVKFDDNILYRGLIKEKCGNDFKVFFVDFGNTSLVKDIYSLPSKYSSLPMFSIPVMISNEKDLEIPVDIDSAFKVKCMGKTEDNIQVVKVYPIVKPILLSSIKTSLLEDGSFGAHFHSFDGKFYYLTKATDSVKINEMKYLIGNLVVNEIYHIPAVDEVLLGKCDDQWQRICVKRVKETLKECEVFLVDVGKTKTVSFANLSYIPANIRTFPIFLVKVSLSIAEPLKETIAFEKCYTVTTLDHSAVVPTIQILQRNMLTSLKRKFLPLNEERNVIFVHKENDILFLQDLNDALTLAETQAEARKCASSKAISQNPLVGELFCAQSDADGDWYRCCVEEVINSDRYKIHYIDYGNSEVVPKSNLRCMPSSVTMNPSFGIPVKIANQLPVTLEQLYSVIAVSEPVNNVQSVELVVKQSASDSLPEDLPKAKTTVAIPHEVNSELATESKFLFSSSQRVSFTPGKQDVAIYNVSENKKTLLLFCTPFNTESIAANIALIDDITKYCESLNCSSYNGDSLPKEDEMVLAKFDEDNQWYRAVVLECAYPLYEVIFIDYGNIGQLHINWLRKMEKKFMSLEIQANLCSLIGFKTSDENLPTIIEELKSFTIFVRGQKPLEANVSFNEEYVAFEIPEITNYLVEKKLVVAEKS